MAASVFDPQIRTHAFASVAEGNAMRAFCWMYWLYTSLSADE
jgi:hypothetical protein